MSRLKSERGQAMVEFALVLPILVLLLCGIIDFGWIFSNKIAADNASREAARYAAIHSNDQTFSVSQVDEVVHESAPLLPSPQIQLSNPETGSVEVSVSADIPFLTGVTSTLLGKSAITVKSASTMKIEQ